jgi:hypothetical protein
MRRVILTATVALLAAGAAGAAPVFDLTVEAGKHDRVNVPVCVALKLPGDTANQQPVLKDSDGKPIEAQLTPYALTRPDPPPLGANVDFRELHFILANLKAGETRKLILTFEPPARKTNGFTWDDKLGEYSELRYDDRPVMRYVCPKFDDSTKENRDRTFKVFHHLYDVTGKTLVTNPGVVGLYPHHRGMFFGFNKVTYGNGKKADVWHGIKSVPGKGDEDAHQTHEKILAEVGGPVLGRQRVAIAWHGEKKEVFAVEEREMTVYHVPGGQLVEFASHVRTTGGPVRLDGDPQHAGFHFRAALEVAEKGKDSTVFVRPDGVGEPGQKGTRNWDPKTRKGPVNMPWNAMSFGLGGKRYTVAYLDTPTNPKEARFSEREYGRIGSYFEYEVTDKKPLVVTYRVWLQEGQMTVEQVAALDADFVDPVQVRVAAK